ncbi:tRNA pseudouridine(54/55) synthase Pus10, partial [Candidatus Bathyarchaeota archaeon]|nr:tRNA pseudouridine(54/55) synthase Pus10 [Candidatus Bathyarchaeota archaeon]
MDIFETSLEMLRKYPLCDRCLGRQFAMLGYNLENFERGRSLKLVLTLQASALAQSRNEKGHDTLQVLAKNGFFLHANATIVQLGNHSPSQNDSEICYLCESSFKNLDKVVRNVLRNVSELEYATFLAGIILPIRVEEREDEFRAEFQVNYGESVKHEFGRSFGKRIAEKTGKAVEFMNPDIVILINPFEENVKIQVNPLFVLGRYKKLVRDRPQSIWFCSNCRGKG